MTIVLMGLNHRTAPVEIREQLAVDACHLGEAYQILGPGIREAVFLSTCNRVEVLVSADRPEVAVEAVTSFLARHHRIAPAEFKDSFYVYQGEEAIRHLFRVASSLDSMVVGEPQILGQLKDAYRKASEHNATGVILNRLMHKSFSVAKRVRTETGIASHAVSIGYAAVELARKIFGDLRGSKVLLVGAGEMAELTAEHLLTNGATEIVVANRTLKRAVELARRWNGRAASLVEIRTLLAEVDIVISSTGSPETVIQAPTVKTVLKARRHRPLFFLDIAVPRDIDPKVNRLDNVYLYDIDDLSAVVEENRAARNEEAGRAQRVVDEEAIAFMGWLETLETFPTITALTQKAEQIRRTEIAKTLNRIGPLDPQQIEALEAMTKALTRKLIHDPIHFIKTAGCHGWKGENLGIIQRVFALDQCPESNRVTADDPVEAEAFSEDKKAAEKS